MGTWLYAFIFHETIPPPVLGRAITNLASLLDLTLEKAASTLTEVDEGHFEPSDKEFDYDVIAPTSQLLNASVMMRNRSIYLSFTAICSAPVPHSVFGWPRSLFCKMPTTQRLDFLEGIAQFAEAIGSRVVVVAAEPAGHLEDRVMFDDEQILIEQATVTDYVDICETWAIASMHVVLLEGEIRRTGFISNYHRWASCPLC